MLRVLLWCSINSEHAIHQQSNKLIQKTGTCQTSQAGCSSAYMQKTRSLNGMDSTAYKQKSSEATQPKQFRLLNWWSFASEHAQTLSLMATMSVRQRFHLSKLVRRKSHLDRASHFLLSFLRFYRADSPHPFPPVCGEHGAWRGCAARRRRCWVRELGRERGGGAGQGVEDQEREDGRQVERSPQRRDDSPENVQIRITYRAAQSQMCQCTFFFLHYFDCSYKIRKYLRYEFRIIIFIGLNDLSKLKIRLRKYALYVYIMNGGRMFLSFFSELDQANCWLHKHCH